VVPLRVAIATRIMNVQVARILSYRYIDVSCPIPVQSDALFRLIPFPNSFKGSCW